MSRWSIEDTNKLIALRAEGYSYIDIAKELSIKEGRVRSKVSYLIKKGVLTRDYIKGRSRDIPYTEDDYIKLIKKYSTFENYQSNVCIDKLPPVDRIRKYYGSWTKARQAAGLDGSIGVLDPAKPTTFYLLYFFDEDFYKVGLTQRSLNDRFSGYPEYCVLDTINTTLDIAKRLESSTLSSYDKYHPQHCKFYREHGGGSGGHTECFKSDEIIEKLTAL